MMITAPNTPLDLAALGHEMYQLIAKLYPICRSITGNGLRDTLKLIQTHLPLEISEVATGTPVFDWTIPKEWNIRDAYVKNSRGDRVIDFRASNLHVVNYSVPVRKRLSLAELKPHLFTLPEHGDWIPYRTTYYHESWGFCLSQRQLDALPDEEYEVCIDASLEEGSLTYGEYYLPGRDAQEILISCHICHPSLCNDNLSGLALAVFLAKHLQGQPLRYSYRFLFIPGTIGAITWLCRNEPHTRQIRHGLVLANVGDAGRVTYKKSRRGNAEIDRAVTHVLQHAAEDYAILEFAPYGYDERQFCSPGFNLPVGCLMRTPHGQFPEYHTSADNLDFVHPAALANSFSKCLSIVDILEHNQVYLNQNPKCEPRLGKRGLYRAMGGQAHTEVNELAMLWVLNLSDGQHTLLDIAERAGLPFPLMKRAAQALCAHGLLHALPAPAVGLVPSSSNGRSPTGNGHAASA